MFLDPLLFFILLILHFIGSDRKKIIIYGIIVGFLAEIMIVSMNYGKNFGDTIILRIIAANFQSVLAYYIVRYFKNRISKKKK
jgi:hypothetical protein